MRFESSLRPDQPLIKTSIVKQITRVIVDIISSHNAGRPSMTALLAETGRGKTITTYAICRSMPPQAHTGKSPALALSVKPGGSGRTILDDLSRQVGNRTARGSHRFVLAQNFHELVGPDHYRLLAFDEADMMRLQTLETARFLHDEYGYSLLFVGLPSLDKLFRTDAKFYSRLSCPDLPDIEEKEILNTVLPRLVIPLWRYDPASLADTAIGKKIFDLCGSDLRRMTHLLYHASQFAQLRSLQAIGIREIDSAYLKMGHRGRGTAPDQ